MRDRSACQPRRYAKLRWSFVVVQRFRLLQTARAWPVNRRRSERFERVPVDLRAPLEKFAR